MNGKALTLCGPAVGGGAAVMIRRWKGESSGAASGHSDRWHTVTINRPPNEVSANGRLPEPPRATRTSTSATTAGPRSCSTPTAAEALAHNPGNDVKKELAP